ncbi:GNAT family N-acetyltransferase [Roseibium sediminis]|uniref:GNAT family N-acetyltransferase n=1 Tax=Roseibium sediminis TaxID=1775174 RepID=UPI00123D1FAF|nr:GNAT family N-acetyltransferase [Roseibium sediminis]
MTKRTNVTIEKVAASGFLALVPRLAEILKACVEGGAGVGFVLPVALDRLTAFWAGQHEALKAGTAHLLVARLDGEIVGTVMVCHAPQDNGQHRAEVAKLLVHPDARRRGIARRLLVTVDSLARSHGKTLLVLDTVTGDTAEGLYPQVGYERVGVIPDYALSPEGVPNPTTVFYKRLSSAV